MKFRPWFLGPRTDLTAIYENRLREEIERPDGPDGEAPQPDGGDETKADEAAADASPEPEDPVPVLEWADEKPSDEKPDSAEKSKSAGDPDAEKVSASQVMAIEIAPRPDPSSELTPAPTVDRPPLGASVRGRVSDVASSLRQRLSGVPRRGVLVVGALAVAAVSFTTALVLAFGGGEDGPSPVAQPSPTTTGPSPAATRPSSRDLAGSAGAATSQGSCTQDCEAPATEATSRRSPVAVAEDDTDGDGGGGSSSFLSGPLFGVAGMVVGVGAAREVRRRRGRPNGLMLERVRPLLRRLPKRAARSATEIPERTGDAAIGLLERGDDQAIGVLVRPGEPAAELPAGTDTSASERRKRSDTSASEFRKRSDASADELPAGSDEPAAERPESTDASAGEVSERSSEPAVGLPARSAAAGTKPAARSERSATDRSEGTDDAGEPAADEPAPSRCDLALAHLAANVRRRGGRAHPQPRVVRVTDDRIDVLLSRPDPSPPSPWRQEASGLSWVLDADVELPAPEKVDALPALFTVGTSGSDVVVDLKDYGVIGTSESDILVNLEAYGVVALVGDQDACRAMARAMARELATRAQGQVAVELVGDLLAGTTARLDGIERHRSWDDVDITVAETSAGFLDSGGWPHTWAARASGRIFDGWVPTVWITEATQESRYREALDAVAARPGAGTVLVVVGNDPGRGLRIELDDHGQFDIPALNLHGTTRTLRPTARAS